MPAISIHFLVKVLIVFSMLYLLSFRSLVKKAIYAWAAAQDNKIELEKYKHDTTIDIDNKIDEKLDLVVEQCFEEYTILNLAYKSDYYIKEEEETEINKKICALVAQRLSDALYEQLCILYNEEAITDIIAKRVYFKTTNFVMEHNNGTGIG